MYSRNMVDYHLVMDMIPAIARMFFLKQLGDISLSTAQCALLLGIGLQHKTVDELEKEIQLPSSQIMGLFNRLICKVVQYFNSVQESAVEAEMAVSKEIAMEPTARTLSEDLDEAAKEFQEKHKKDMEQIKEMDLTHKKKRKLDGTKTEQPQNRKTKKQGKDEQGNDKNGLPVVDFDVYRLGVDDVADEKLDVLAKELKTAFTEVGFVYLKNNGISQEEVDAIMDVSKNFFLLPDEKKMPFRRGNYSEVNHGWVCAGSERLNPKRPSDLKEAFNVTSLNPSVEWPSNDVVPDFREKLLSFFQRCKDLSLRVLRVLELSLGVAPGVFLGKHSRVGGEQNGTTLRLLYYPQVRPESVKEGQVRCGEHSDYGSITMLFQGLGGPLQVLDRTGSYINAPRIPGTVLINIGDLMQRWTADVFVSVKHRVLLPPPGDMSTRQSIAFFLHPNDDSLITCTDGSDKYPPVNALDYLNERFSHSYGKK